MASKNSSSSSNSLKTSKGPSQAQATPHVSSAQKTTQAPKRPPQGSLFNATGKPRFNNPALNRFFEDSPSPSQSSGMRDSQSQSHSQSMQSDSYQPSQQRDTPLSDGFISTRSVIAAKYQQDTDSRDNPLRLQELLLSPEFPPRTQRDAVAPTRSSTSIVDHGSVTNGQSLVDLLFRVDRREAPIPDALIPGQLSWLTHPKNTMGYNLYPDIDRNSEYGALTLDLCAFVSVEYYTTYRTEVSLPLAVVPPTLSIPNLSSDAEYVPTNFIFKRWVTDVINKFSTRYNMVLHSVLRPDPLNDKEVRAYFLEIVRSKKRQNAVGLTGKDELAVNAYLQQRIVNYNQANAFLAEVIRNTVTRQKERFPTLYQRIQMNTNNCTNNAHLLFYALKSLMAETQDALLTKTGQQMRDLKMQLDANGFPDVRTYVQTMNSLAETYTELNGTVDPEDLLSKFRAQGRELIARHPALNNNTHFRAMLNGPDFNTWEKHLQFNEALTDMVVVAQNASAFEKQVASFGVQNILEIGQSLSHKPTTAIAAVSKQVDYPDVNVYTVRANAHCVLHPSGTHKNDQCNLQKELRDNNVSGNDLIKALVELQVHAADSRRKARIARDKARKAERQHARTSNNKSQSRDRQSSASPTPNKSSQRRNDYSSTRQSKSSTPKRNNDDDSVPSKGSNASSKKKRKVTRESQPTQEDVAHVVTGIHSGRGSPDFRSDEDKSSENEEDEPREKHFRRARLEEYWAESRRDQETEDNEQDLFESQEISETDRSLMTATSPLTESSSNQNSVFTVTEVQNVKSDKPVVYKFDEDGIPYHTSDDESIDGHYDFEYDNSNNPDLGYQRSKIRPNLQAPIREKGRPEPENVNGESILYGLNVYEWAELYCNSLIDNVEYEGHSRCSLRMLFTFTLEAENTLRRSLDKPKLNRKHIGRVAKADKLHSRYQGYFDRVIKAKARVLERKRQVSTHHIYADHALTLLHSNGPTQKRYPKRNVDVVDCSNCSSDSMHESSIALRPNKRRKLTKLYFQKEIANVVIFERAHLACNDRYDSIIDSGATCHVTNQVHFATESYNFRKAHPGDGVALGDNNIKLPAIGYCNIGILQNVMIVPKMTINLISASKLDLLGYAMIISDQKFKLIKGTKIHVSGPLLNGLYHTNLRDFLPKVNVTNIALAKKLVSKTRSKSVIRKDPEIKTDRDVELLHKRIGHASVTNVIEGLKSGTLSGYTVTAKRIQKKWNLQNGICHNCMLGKSKLPSFSRSVTSKGETKGDYVVTDIVGPFSTATFEGETLAVTYTDWYSKYSWTFLLKRKSDALTCLKYLIEVIFKAARVELRHYHSDNAGELCGKETVDYLERVVHATHSTSEPYTPQRNAVAERKFRTLGEMAATMLHESGLPTIFWGFAYQAATYIRNRIPTVTRDGRVHSPYELWNDKVPNIRHLRRWGCKCYAHIPKATLAKDFLPKCRIGYLVGYTEENSYLVWIPESKKVITTVSIVFDERIPEHKEAYWGELATQVQVGVPTGTLADYQYLVGTPYVDPEHGVTYVTTRVVVEKGLIVAYRVPLQSDGTKNTIEEPRPIHVKDVVQMIQASTKISSGGQLATPTTQPPTGEASPVGKKSRHRKRLITSALSRATVPRDSASKPRANISSTKKRSKYISINKPTVSRMRRIRTQRRLTNAACLGDVGYNVSSTDTVIDGLNSDPYTAPPNHKDKHSNTESSIMQYAYLVEHQDMVPKNYKEAMSSKDANHWQKAVADEVKSLIDLGTWEVVPPPKDYYKAPRTCAFIFKKKYTGATTKFKARLVAHGNKQKYGMDYWETYAPVSSSRAIRTLLAIAASKKMTIHQLDIDTAFLNADLQEEIYMSPPDGIPNIPNGHLLRLKKSIYGLKQSPRNFNINLNKHIESMGFKRCVSDTCIYLKTVNDKDVYISVYVDDIIIACQDDNIIADIKTQIATKYKIKDMGEMDWYLGMRYTRDKLSGVITLDQSKYASDVLTKFKGFYHTSPYHTSPMEMNLKLPVWKDGYENKLSAKSLAYIKAYPYRQVVGSLLYLAIWTRPDITYAVHLVAKHCVHPTLEAIHACNRILSYISMTKHLGLIFYPGNLKLSTFVDSSFGDIPEDRRSTGGLIQYLGYSPIYWETFIADTTVPLSTCEAEYVAAHVAGRELMCTNNLLTELKYPQYKIPMYEDNTSCITVATQEASKHKTKHVSIKIHYIRDLIHKKFIDIIYISTHLQLADIFTKATSREDFLRHRDVLLGKPPTGELAMYLSSAKELYNSNRSKEDMDNRILFHPNYQPPWINGFI